MPVAPRILRALVLVGLSAGLVAPAVPAHAEPSVGDIQKKIEKSSAQLEDVVESYNKISEDLKATRAATATLQAKLQPLERQLAATSADVAKLAVTAYKSGQPSAANALLTGPTSGTLLARLSTLDRLARERRARVSSYTDTAERYRTQRQQLDTARARQIAQARQLVVRKKKIQADLKKLYELRRQAYGRATAASGGGYTGKVPAVSGGAGKAVSYAYGAIGRPYVWGAEGPGGYDCSGLTLAAWRTAGKSLPHNAAMQWNAVSHIGRGQLRPGDLVFYRGLAHVALYVGGGKVIHAPTFGENVQLASVDMMSPYGYGRVR